MALIHNGVELTDEQIAAINPVLIAHMNGAHRGKKKFHAALDKALEEAGCPAVAPSAQSVKDAAPSPAGCA